MSLNLKQASLDLLKVADQIDKEASEKTFFTCDKCGHKSSLASINACRTKLASKMASDPKLVTVRNVTVNDKVSCGAVECSGVMSYSPTVESERYYVEAAEEDPFQDEGDQTAPPTEDKPDTLNPDKKEDMDEEHPSDQPPAEDAPPDEGDIIDESVFEPVDEQDSKKAPAPQEPEEQGGEEAPEPSGSEPSFEETPRPMGPTNPSTDDELMPEEKPDQGKPQDDAHKPTDDEIPMEDTPEETPPEEKPEEAPSEGSPEGTPPTEPPAEPPVDEPAVMSPPGEEDTDESMKPEGEEPEGEEEEEDSDKPKRKGPTSPKFTEMPEDMKDLKIKTASHRFWNSVARYTLK